MKKFCVAMSVLLCVFLVAFVLMVNLSKIPETPAGDFEYRYDPNLEGIVLTGYTGTSIKVRIPEKIEGVPVVRLYGQGKRIKM